VGLKRGLNTGSSHRKISHFHTAFTEIHLFFTAIVFNEVTAFCGAALKKMISQQNYLPDTAPFAWHKVHSPHLTPQPQITQHENAAYSSGSLNVRLATHASDLAQAQRLRHAVFLDEFGVNCGQGGVDADEFDAFCDHLLVQECATGRVVGTYRMLNSANAKRCGKRYGQDEFSGQLWQQMGDNMVELGRACIHPSFRSGAALMKLWQGIMDYLSRQQARYAIGYASVGLRDGGLSASATFQFLAKLERVWPGDQLQPITPYSAVRAIDIGELGEPPALIKGYARMGAFSIGAPAFDPVFNTADFPMLLDMTQLDKRYARHFNVAKSLSTLN
jgi:putative hemolysin